MSTAVTCARCATSGRLQLQLGGLRPLSVSYTDPALLARYRSMVASRDALLRAVDVARRPIAAAGQRIVWDATAGLGRDAGALAFAGAAAGAHWLRVVLLEREPYLVRLLEQALAEASSAGSLEWLRHATVVQGDSVHALRVAAAGTADVRPAVVYLDPMFATPPAVGSAGGNEGAPVAAGAALSGGHRRRRTALPQRELQYVAAVAGATAATGDTERLLAAALAAATERVVVKRHRGAAPVGVGAGVAPAFHVLSGHAVRYDVYRVD